MVWLRRIARCWPNAVIGLRDECGIVEIFIRSITPKLGAYALVHPLGKSFRDSGRRIAARKLPRFARRVELLANAPLASALSYVA